VFLHERLDGGVLDDDQFFPIAGARNPRPLGKYIEASADALAAGFNK